MKKTPLIFCLLFSVSASAEMDDSWRQFDNDKNNELSLEEYSSLRIAQYVALDRNGDNQWTRREFVMRSDDMSNGRKDALRGKFKRRDKNGDGLWSTAEAEKAIGGSFRWLDKNRNKSLSINEFPKQF